MTVIRSPKKEHFDQHPIWEWTKDKEHYQPRDLTLDISDRDSALFIEAKLFTKNGLEFEGYIAWSSGAYAFSLFIPGIDYCGGNIHWRSLAIRRFKALCETYNCDFEDLFPMRYETDFSDDDGNPIAGKFDFIS